MAIWPLTPNSMRSCDSIQQMSRVEVKTKQQTYIYSVMLMWVCNVLCSMNL